MKPIAIYYLNTVLRPVQEAARECGYAVALHGSMERDFDLIAVPWVDDAKPAAELVEAVRAAVNGTIIEDGTPAGRYDKEQGKFVPAVVRNPAFKPHGRLAWSIQLGGGAYVDLSVTQLSYGHRCPVCSAGMCECEKCGREWCLDHQPNPLVCPGCGSRPSDDEGADKPCST